MEPACVLGPPWVGGRPGSFSLLFSLEYLGSECFLPFGLRWRKNRGNYDRKRERRGEREKTRVTVMKRCARRDGGWESAGPGQGAGVQSLGWRVEWGSRQPGRASKPGRGTREPFPTGDFCPGRETGARLPGSPRGFANRGIVKWQRGVSDSPGAVPEGKRREFLLPHPQHTLSFWKPDKVINKTIRKAT